MVSLLRTTRAELLKIRRTRALWLAVGAPLTVVALFVALVLAGAIDPSENGWMRPAQGILVTWAMLMLPLYVALETALINGIDHNSSGWTHVFALPVPRWSVHLAKLLVALGAVGLSTVVLAGGLSAVIAVLEWMGSGSGADLPWRFVACRSLDTYGGALAIIALHHGLSMRLRGFEAPVGLGMIGAVVGTQVSASSEYWFFFPWSYPTVASSASDPDARLLALALSAALAVGIALVTTYDTATRDIA